MKLYGIGVGPGDPDLITVKAQEVLQRIDVLFVPKSTLARESVALNIAEKYIKNHTKLVEIYLPMTKDKAVLKQAWHDGARKITDNLEPNKSGAFITLGDCMLYSTYTYLLREIEQLKNITIINIPGITSFSAAASMVGVSLAEGEENLVIIPALTALDNLDNILALHDNVVFLKVAPQITLLIEKLIECNLIDNAVFISKCGHPEQKIVYDIKKLKNTEVEYLSLMIVKKGGI